MILRTVGVGRALNRWSGQSEILDIPCSQAGGFVFPCISQKPASRGWDGCLVFPALTRDQNMYQAAQDLADKALTPFTTGLILLDAQNRVSYHNPEALNILTYLTAAKTPLHVPPRILQSLLPGNNISKLEISHIDFKSGRRRYTARSFVLSHSSGKLEQAVTGILKYS